MVWGPPGSDERRIKIGLVFLLIGCLLLIWAWGFWAFRTSAVGAAPASANPMVFAEARAVLANSQILQMLPRMLIFVLVLAFVCLFGSYTLLRMARRHRAASERTRASPTISESVWEKHRLPRHEEQAKPEK